MSPENSSVVIIDDDRKWTVTFERYLMREGHQVLGTAYTKKEAFELIQQIKDKQTKDNGIKVIFFLIDGNLSKNSYFGQDGRELAETVRAEFPGAGVISISSLPQEWSDTPKLTIGDLESIVAFITQTP